MSDIQKEYGDLSCEEALKKLASNPKEGLNESEAQKRLQENGFNELDEKKESKWLILARFFWGPIPWMIEIALILSAILKRWPDFYIILAMLLINALLGFFQEFQAGNAIEALKEKLALKSFVLRSGKWLELEAKKIVTGDILKVKLGNVIPADLKLISGEYLSVDQSSLTGESLPVDKKVGDLALSGTIAKKGEMVGVVIATGMKTSIGKTARLVQSAQTQSHFQKAVLEIGRFLIITTLFISAIIVGLSLMREAHLQTHESLGELAIFILVLVIAGIPVALPAVLSVTMAIGAHKLAYLKAIVAKLTSIEELANMNVLCSDKTGTLTKNQLEIREVKCCEKVDEKELLICAALTCSKEQPDAIDQAIFNKFQENESLLREYHIDKFIPFDPVRKASETTAHKESQPPIHCTKGATQVILEMCKNQASQDWAHQIIEDLASKGLRSLAVAKRNDENSPWILLGILSLYDPPREDTKETIKKLNELGLRIHMVTGDNQAIAKQMAKELGLGDRIAKASELKQNLDQIETFDGFAEVFPENKFEIIQALQKKNHILGMTGDGVNDAPALKQADVGIAVSGASDAARSSADLVLTEPGLMTIYHAVQEARRIFGRMKSYAMYRISETCRLLLFLMLALIIFQERPLSAIMVILIALLNDIPIMTIAYDNMEVKKDPTVWNMQEVFTISIGLSIVGVISTFGLYWIGINIWKFDLSSVKTLVFMGLLCGGNLTIYLMRNEKFLWSSPLPNWRFMIATTFSLVVGTLISAYGLNSSDFIGIGWKYVFYTWIYLIIWFVICFLTKLLLYAIFSFKTQSGKKSEN